MQNQIWNLDECLPANHNLAASNPGAPVSDPARRRKPRINRRLRRSALQMPHNSGHCQHAPRTPSAPNFAFDPNGKSRVACDPFILVMFDTIRKHQKWLWFGIIGIMILTMVIWTNQGGGNNRGGSGNFGSIDNKAINATEMRHAQNDVMLMYLTQTHPHQWPQVSEADLQRQVYQQLYILRKLDEYNIHADPDAAARA